MRWSQTKKQRWKTKKKIRTKKNRDEKKEKKETQMNKMLDFFRWLRQNAADLSWEQKVPSFHFNFLIVVWFPLKHTRMLSWKVQSLNSEGERKVD
jgi:hypothetical protein